MTEDDVSSSPEIVRPSASRRMTPEEEEAYKKNGGLKKNDLVIYEAFDPDRNCLLIRETLKVTRVSDARTAADTPLEMKVLKREEFFVEEDEPPRNETVLSKKPGKGGGGGSGVDPGLIFEIIQWTYELLQNSSGVETEPYTLNALLEGTNYSDYYGFKEDKVRVQNRWRNFFGLTLAEVTSEVTCQYDAKPRSDSIPPGKYLTNVVARAHEAYTLKPFNKLEGKVTVSNPGNCSQDPVNVIPQVTMVMEWKHSELNVGGGTKFRTFKVNGESGVQLVEG